MHLAGLLPISGDRLVTPWLTVFDTKKLRKIPFLDVELRRAGEELLGVSAKVRKSALAGPGL